MDFKKLLSTFDAVENDTSENAVNKKKEAGSMLAILESFDNAGNSETTNKGKEIKAQSQLSVPVEENESMTRNDALKQDRKNGFHHDEEDGYHYVFGADSGFAYSQHRTADDAEKQAAEMNKNYANTNESALEDLDEISSNEEVNEAIIVSAEGAEAAELLSILKLSGIEAPAASLPVPMEPETGPEMDMQDEYSNSPDEMEQDIAAVIASGDDMHREKNQYAASADGDNPMKAFEGKFKAIMNDLLAEDEK